MDPRFGGIVLLFTHDFKAMKSEKVYLADDKTLDIMGKGDVVVRTTNGGTLKLHDVRYIPGLAKNLIFVSQLDSCGYKTVTCEGRWKIAKGSMILARGTKMGTLYTIARCTDMVAAPIVDETKL